MDAKVTAPITKPATAEDIYERSVGTISERIEELESRENRLVWCVAGLLAMVLFVAFHCSLEIGRLSKSERDARFELELLQMSVYGTNDAVGRELRRINKHTGMSRFEWNAGGAE